MLRPPTDIPNLSLLTEIGRELAREAANAVRRRAATMVAPDLDAALQFERTRNRELAQELGRVQGVLDSERGLREEIIRQHNATTKTQDEQYRRMLKEAHRKTEQEHQKVLDLERRVRELEQGRGL